MSHTDLERRLTRFLTAESSRAVDTDIAWRELRSRRQARQGKHRLLTAVSAAVAVAVAVTIPALVAHRADVGKVARLHAARPPQVGTVATYPQAVVARIPASAWQLAGVQGAVWVLGSAPGQLVRIDTGTNKITRQLALPAGATSAASIATGGGALWLNTGAGQVQRLDPATGAVVVTVHLPETGNCSGAEFGAGGLWVQCVSGNRTKFVRIDPATNGVNASIGPMPGKVFVATAAANSLWYLDGSGGVRGLIRQAARWRAVSVHVPITYPVAFEHPVLVSGAGAVWALTNDESIARINPENGQVTRVFTYRDYDPTYQDLLVSLAAGASSLWLLGRGDVLRVDAATGHPLGSVPVSGSCGQPCVQIYFAQGSVWFPATSELSRIDPAKMGG